MEGLIAALEATAPAAFLRQSWWAYPAVNIAHLLGIGALYGAVLVMDLRLIAGGDPRGAAPAKAVAAGGLAVAAATGAALFAVRAVEYAAMPVFWVKMALVALAAVNLAALEAGLTAGRGRLAGAVSLAAWTGVIAAGRLLGYFEG